MKKLIVFLALIFFLVPLWGCSNPFTPAGSEGYVKENPRIWGTGGFRGALIGPKNFGVSLWRNEVENIDFRPETYHEKFQILTKDELNVSLSFQAVMRIKPNSIKDVVEKFGGAEIYIRYVKEPFRAMVRKNVQSLQSREVKERREEIAMSVKKELVEYLKNTPFIVLSCVVGNIDYPEIVTRAVEKKLAAKQLLDEKETQREIAKKDAEIKIEEAKGIAKAQEIINSTLTTNYLQHEAIQAQLKMASSPNHTTVYIPSGLNGIPLVGIVNKK